MRHPHITMSFTPEELQTLRDWGFGSIYYQEDNNSPQLAEKLERALEQWEAMNK